jgi:hypothetical protein
MKLQVALVGNAQKRVPEAAVADEHFGRLDLPFAEVLEPRRQLPEHEHAGQEIEVTANCGLADRQRAGQLGADPGRESAATNCRTRVVLPH